MTRLVPDRQPSPSVRCQPAWLRLAASVALVGASLSRGGAQVKPAGLKELAGQELTNTLPWRNERDGRGGRCASEGAARMQNTRVRIESFGLVRASLGPVVP
jgi:hypothetical protein